MKRGFTIIEMMVVASILAVLVTIVVAGFSGVYYGGRHNKAMAMRHTLQNALETYYTRKGEWPGVLNNLGDSMQKPEKELSEDETDQTFRELLKECVKSAKNPLFDYSDLMVARSATAQYGCKDADRAGREYLKQNLGLTDAELNKVKCVTAYTLKEALQKGWDINGLACGYVGPNNGHFCRYRIVYNAKTDRVSVLAQKTTEGNYRDK